MLRKFCYPVAALTLSLMGGLSLGLQQVQAAELFGLTPRTVELQSAGALAFGPSGVLFIGDAKAAKVYAINTEDEKLSVSASYDIENLSEQLAATLGRDQVVVNDLAVNPETGNAFLSVTAGDQSAVVRVAADGSISALNLDKIAHAAVALPRRTRPDGARSNDRYECHWQ